MNNKKIKTIENKEDAIIFLNQLIVLVYKRIQRLKRSIVDLENEIKKYDEKSTKVRTDTYDRLSENIECNTIYLYNLFGDETSTAVSYAVFRKITEKKVKQGRSEFLLNSLDDDVIQLLNEFRNIRNWSHHVPQLLLNSQIEYMNEHEKSKDIVKLQFSLPIIPILVWEYHELSWLKNLYDGSSEAYSNFQKVFQCMKKDYSKLVGKSMSIAIEFQKTARPFSFNLIPEYSYDINTGKIK